MLQNNNFLSNLQLLEVLSYSESATAIYISEDLHIQFANDGMISIWGKDKSVIGKTLEEALPELKDQPFPDLLKTVWKTGKTYEAKDTPANLEVKGKIDTFYFDFIYRAIPDENGNTYCILHTAKEVTSAYLQRKALEEAGNREHNLNEQLASTNEELISSNEELASSNEELTAINEELNLYVDLLEESRTQIKNIIEVAPIGMCVLRGKDLVVEIANKEILRIWGRTEEQVLNKPHSDARPELKGQPMLKWLDEVYRDGIPRVNNEIKISLYDPSTGTRDAIVNSMYQPIKDSKGEVTAILAILEEITEQVKIRNENFQMQDMYNRAIEAAELGTFDLNPVNNKFTANNLLKSWFGLQPDEEVDLNLATEVIDEIDRPRVEKAIQSALSPQSGGIYDIEYSIISKNGLLPRNVRAKGKASFNERNEPIRLNGTLQDITDRKQDEQRKNDFFGIVSHELKTPLTSLKGYLQVMQMKAEKTSDTFYLQASEKALNQTNKMNSLIKGFLDVTRFDSGRIHLYKEWFDITELVKEVVDETQLHTPHHKIDYEKCQAIQLYADREKIGQVISNFISNAIKYSPDKETISVQCRLNEKNAEISIKDNGIGIEKKDQHKLFERFYRVESMQTQFISGFGIGLYLSSEIVKRHDGTIGVDSEPGKGSVFYFSLPV